MQNIRDTKKPSKSSNDAQKIVLVRDSRVSMLTFGGKQFYTMKADTEFLYDFVVEKNESYTVFQSGLNFYVFETKAVDHETSCGSGASAT